jgi:hypothetical protein
MPGNAPFPATSDVDILIVRAAGAPDAAKGKLRYRGVLLDVAHTTLEQLGPVDRVLGDYHVAPAFRSAEGILADPQGELGRLQQAIGEEFTRAAWVRARCGHAQSHSLRYARSLDATAPFHSQVMSWIFATGVTTHVLLSAGMRNPTVRRRYVDVGGMLAEYGRDAMYEELLSMLGCADMTAARAMQHLEALALAFDAATAALKTPVVFAGDISAVARVIAIDGSRDLIERGLHREAVFWLVVTVARSIHILANDAAPEVHARHDGDMRALLADLSIVSSDDIQRRCDAIKSFMPRLGELAEEIVEANPDVRA